MFSTVSAYMNTNKSLWSGVKAISDTVDDLDAGIADISDSAGKQQTPVTGAAAQKAQVRHSYEEQILFIADQLAAFAEATNFAELAGQVEMSLSSLDKLADDQLEEKGTLIANLAMLKLADLADYGITQADIDALKSLTTQFHAAKTAPRSAVASRSGETNTLPDKIAEVTSILRNRLDKLNVERAILHGLSHCPRGCGQGRQLGESQACRRDGKSSTRSTVGLKEIEIQSQPEQEIVPAFVLICAD
jgi:hypothetical protein